MRENRWSYRPRKRKWVTTTHSNHDLPIYPNLIKNLTIQNVNQLRVADIISIRILACFVHLAVILDAFSRKAIGYALSQRLDTRLALGALQMAPGDRHPEPDCIHHSDPGVQCASREYVKKLTSYNVRISMSRKATPFDNAHAASFIKPLKSEEVHLWEYHTMEDVREMIPSFIEEVYNQKRLHSSLGYRPPREFEAIVMVTQNPCQSALISTP